METALNHGVKLVEECRISPPSNSVPPTSLPLTIFDVGWLPLPPLHLLLFYESNQPTSHFITNLLPNIKDSLSITLKHFYPLAGNLTCLENSTVPEIVYNYGDTVSLTVSESDYDFSFLASNLPRYVDLFHPLTPKFPTCNNVLPLLALQVTFFPNKGICVGVAYNHVVGDGRAITHFIKSWASVCKFKEDMSIISKFPPFTDRSGIKEETPGQILSLLGDYEKIGITKDTCYVPKNIDMVKGVRVRATFVMATSHIKSLKQQILVRNGNEVHLSSLVVACAYVWVCWMKTKSMKTNDHDIENEKKYYLIIPADMRARLQSPLPSTYFGNCLVCVDVMSKRSELLGEDGIAIAAKLIGKGIENIGSDKPKDLSFYLSTPPEQIMSFTNSPKFAVYDADFGWGKPKKVEMGGDAISLSECPNDDAGIEIGWVRDKEDMDAFAVMFAKSLPALS